MTSGAVLPNTTTVATNGITTRFAVSPESGKPCLVLIHSLACQLDMWAPQWTALEPHFRLLAYDVRGHGGSSAPEGPYSMDMWTDDLFALLDSQGINDCHIVGLSMGGMIAQTAALRSDRVRSIVVADSTGKWPDEAGPLWTERREQAKTKGMPSFVNGFLGRWSTPEFAAINRAMLDEVASWIAGTTPTGFVGSCEAISRVDTLGRLPALTIPALIMVGADDPGTPPAFSERIAAAIPDAELVIIPDARHIANMQQPGIFNAALIEFYRRNGVIG
jgi:3-oxoadipate enol-lactonase